MTEPLILVVDDEPQIRRVLKATLGGEGYQVADVRSGEEALEQIGDLKPDLVLLDLNMPGLGGLETCRRIRKASEVAIIVVTVRGEEQEKVRVLDAGADDYVTKPFSMPELLARIRAALRRTATPKRERAPVPGLDIDWQTRMVTVQGKQSHLTPKEYELLEFFLTHPNEAIPHRKLLQAVWGPDYGDEVEYLRVFINQLRKKIEKNPSKPEHLLTEPWVGYRFHVPA